MVPAISNKLVDIPSDDYSWRKFGQKPIKGSPYLRFGFVCVCVDFMNCCVVLDLLADFATLELNLFGRVYWLLFCNVSDL